MLFPTLSYSIPTQPVLSCLVPSHPCKIHNSQRAIQDPFLCALYLSYKHNSTGQVLCSVTVSVLCPLMMHPG